MTSILGDRNMHHAFQIYCQRSKGVTQIERRIFAYMKPACWRHRNCAKCHQRNVLTFWTELIIISVALSLWLMQKCLFDLFDELWLRQLTSGVKKTRHSGSPEESLYPGHGSRYDAKYQRILYSQHSLRAKELSDLSRQESVHLQNTGRETKLR